MLRQPLAFRLAQVAVGQRGGVVFGVSHHIEIGVDGLNFPHGPVQLGKQVGPGTADAVVKVRVPDVRHRHQTGAGGHVGHDHRVHLADVQPRHQRGGAGILHQRAAIFIFRQPVQQQPVLVAVGGDADAPSIEGLRVVGVHPLLPVGGVNVVPLLPLGQRGKPDGLGPLCGVAQIAHQVDVAALQHGQQLAEGAVDIFILPAGGIGQPLQILVAEAPLVFALAALLIVFKQDVTHPDGLGLGAGGQRQQAAHQKRQRQNQPPDAVFYRHGDSPSYTHGVHYTRFPRKNPDGKPHRKCIFITQGFFKSQYRASFWTRWEFPSPRQRTTMVDTVPPFAAA